MIDPPTLREDHQNLIEAAPGWHVAKFRIGMEGPNGWPDSLTFEPVIKWEVDRERGGYALTPITASGNPTEASIPWAVKGPDGTFDKQGRLYEDEEELIRYLRRCYEENLPARLRAGMNAPQIKLHREVD
jgi:hypothetical protein